MLSRNDLVKQFDLVVKQEIKNHNDQILNTNIAIDQLRKEIAEFPKSIQNAKNSLGAECKQLYDITQEIAQEIDEFKQKTTNLISEIQKLVRQEKGSLLEMISDLAEQISLISIDERKISKIELDILKLEKVCRENFSSISHDLKRVENQGIDRLASFKKELENRPCKASEVKKEISSLVDGYRLETSGVLRELRIVKKDTLYNEKKIEALLAITMPKGKNAEVSCHRPE